MSAARLASIDRIVTRGITAGGYPGASVVIGRRGYAVVQKGFGKIGWTSSSARVTADRTIYDLASLTKVVGTTTAAMLLFDEGKLDLDAPVHTYLPAFSGGWKDSVTVRQLLTHRSGLPAGRDLWRVARTPDEARAAVLATNLECRPGQCYIYSDLGADVLGFVVEAVAGESLDHLLHDRVFEPLGMNDTFYRPADSVVYRTAPTEIAPPRGYPLRGEVHDENAYALGGGAGPAGLFSTAPAPDRTPAAPPLPAARAGARRDRLRARRRRRSRGPVQHCGRSLDLRADDAERRRIQRHSHSERHGRRAVHAPHRRNARARLGY